MITGIVIRQHNKQAHLDIVKDMIKQKEGIFTFILRINAGNIVDYVLMENESYKGVI